MTDEFEFTLDHLPLKKPSQVASPELVVLYGPPGGGKTYLAASASEVEGLAPVLIIDTEGSASGTVSNFADDNIDILEVDSFDRLEYILGNLLDKTHKYKTVIIDTFDVAQKWAVETFQEENPGNGFKAWGDVADWTVQVARDLKRADFLSIMVFHEKEDILETGKRLSKLALQGSAKDILPGVPDVLGLVTRKADKEGNETTTLTFAPDPSRATKNRFNLPARVEDATMQTLFDLIDKKKKEED